MNKFLWPVDVVVLICCTLSAVPTLSVADEAEHRVNESHVTDSGRPQLMHVTTAAPSGSSVEYTGRILAKAEDGSLLLEDRAGSLHQLDGTTIQQVTDLGKRYSALNRDEMADFLLSQSGDTFHTEFTEHFVICSDASELYTQFVGRLLERVADQYMKFFSDSATVRLSPLPTQLPVLIFRNNATFQEFAGRQHPDSDFRNVPGYYSVQHNQILISAIAGDGRFRSHSELLRALKRSLRHVETVVHESVHQLTFNSGLFVRYADTPVWLSEGFAVYFEPAAGRGNLMWSIPGGVSKVHLPGYRNAAADDQLRLPLRLLLSSDEAFHGSSQQLSDAYAESWALTWHLIKKRRQQFDRFLAAHQKLRPLEGRLPEQRLAEFERAFGTPVPDIEQELISGMSRVRSR